MSCETDSTLYVGAVGIGDFTFRNPSTNALVDPSVVKVDVEDPHGVQTTYIYGTDDEIEKTSVGTYTVAINLTLGGTWYWRSYSTGNYKGAREESFEVQASRFS